MSDETNSSDSYRSVRRKFTKEELIAIEKEVDAAMEDERKFREEMRRKREEKVSEGYAQLIMTKFLRVAIEVGKEYEMDEIAFTESCLQGLALARTFVLEAQCMNDEQTKRPKININEKLKNLSPAELIEIGELRASIRAKLAES